MMDEWHMTEAQAPAASQRQAERKRRRAARFAMVMLSCARSKMVSSRAMRETCGSRSRRPAAARSTGNRDHLHVRFDERRVPFRSTEASPASGDQSAWGFYGTQASVALFKWRSPEKDCARKNGGSNETQHRP